MNMMMMMIASSFWPSISGLMDEDSSNEEKGYSPEFSWWPLRPSNVFDVIWKRASNGDESEEFRLPLFLLWGSQGRTIFWGTTTFSWLRPLWLLSLWGFSGLWLRISVMEKDFTPADLWLEADSAYTNSTTKIVHNALHSISQAYTRRKTFT